MYDMLVRKRGFFITVVINAAFRKNAHHIKTKSTVPMAILLYFSISFEMLIVNVLLHEMFFIMPLYDTWVLMFDIFECTTRRF